MRSQLVLPILSAARRCVLCTGTPALNRPVELFTLLNTLRPDVPEFKTYKTFVDRYCAAHLRFGYRGARRLDVSGCSNAEELHGLMTRHALVRRLKVDVLTQLPPKRRQRVLLTLSGGKQQTAATAELAALSKALAAIPKSDERGRQHILSSMCVALGSAKAAAAAEYVLELLPSCEKILFFGHHMAMLDAVHGAIEQRGVRTLRIDGSVPAVERAALVSTFQSLPPGSPCVFILSIQAAGQGLTLTAASTAVFGELRWVD